MVLHLVRLRAQSFYKDVRIRSFHHTRQTVCWCTITDNQTKSNPNGHANSISLRLRVTLATHNWRVGGGGGGGYFPAQVSCYAILFLPMCVAVSIECCYY